MLSGYISKEPSNSGYAVDTIYNDKDALFESLFTIPSVNRSVHWVATYAMPNRISLYRLWVNEDKCVNCNACTKVCKNVLAVASVLMLVLRKRYTLLFAGSNLGNDTIPRSRK